MKNIMKKFEIALLGLPKSDFKLLEGILESIEGSETPEEREELKTDFRDMLRYMIEDHIEDDETYFGLLSLRDKVESVW